jgi:hypothetical protein
MRPKGWWCSAAQIDLMRKPFNQFGVNRFCIATSRGININGLRLQRSRASMATGWRLAVELGKALRLSSELEFHR